MDEFRRHPYRCPLGRPEGLYRLDVFHDYGAFPVWGRDTVPPRAGRPARELLGSLNSEYLCISPQLGTDLRAWSDLHGGHGEWGASAGDRRAVGSAPVGRASPGGAAGDGGGGQLALAGRRSGVPALRGAGGDSLGPSQRVRTVTPRLTWSAPPGPTTKDR